MEPERRRVRRAGRAVSSARKGSRRVATPYLRSLAMTTVLVVDDSAIDRVWLVVC